ncbi:MAG: hypothetical protein R3E89_12290, partial [Thiolinea sp.]
GMSRDEIRMETKSLNSPTYQAVVNSISSAANSSYTPYSGDLQAAQSRLATCRKRVEQGIYRDCAESEARVQAVREMIAQANASKASRALALASTAKSMERDENNYHPLVNLIRSTFGWAGIVASFALSITIIVFFEYAFHYLGRRFAEARDHLDTTRRIRKTPTRLQAMLNEVHDLERQQDRLRAERERANRPVPGAESVQRTPYTLSARSIETVYREVRQQVIAAAIKPTVRPVTEVIAQVVREHAQRFGVKSGAVPQPYRQQLACELLERLAGEGVLIDNPNGGVGKPKYVLAGKYRAGTLDSEEDQLDMPLNRGGASHV